MNRMARAALQTAHAARLTGFVVEWAGKQVASIRKGYAAAITRAGLTDVTIHQIRHSVAVRMLAAGRPLEEVSQFLGHSDTHITRKTYARFMPEHLAGAAEVMDLSWFNEPGRTLQRAPK